MITTIELKALVRNLVRNSGVLDLIDGDVYVGLRPTNSAKNDIVIGSLSVGSDVLNSSTILINIYAKDIQDENTFYPDYTTLKNVTKYLYPIVHETLLNGSKTWLEVESQKDYKVESSQEWVSCLRLITRTIN